MIIDFHTHVYPDKIAARTVEKLEESGGIRASTDGTLLGLKQSMKKSGIDVSVVLPVATRPSQFDTINKFAAEINGKDGLISFGGIHPDCEEPEEKLNYIKSLGLRGIKMHPDYQGVYIDDERYIRIITHCRRIGLAVILHSGVDISYTGDVHCTVPRLLKMLDRTEAACDGHPDYRMILAHFGAADLWDDVEASLIGRDVYFDTAFILDKISVEQFIRIVSKHGADRILFATDSPWSAQSEFVRIMQNMPLTDNEKSMIFSENARIILKI